MPEPEFSRVHPISPFIRGGLVVVAVAGYLVSQQVESIMGTPDSPPGPGEGGPQEILLQAALVGVVVLGAMLLGLMSWWFTRYRLAATSLEMHSGAVMRQHRQVRYDRIQAVDLVRPLLARLTGLSEVRVESAGGGDSHVSIAYLRHAEAEAVRARLLGLAEAANAPAAPAASGQVSGAVTDDGALPGALAAPSSVVSPHPGSPALGGTGQPARPLLRVPAQRLVGSVLLSWDAIFFSLLLLVATVLTLVEVGVVIGGFVPLVLVTGMRSLTRLTRWYGLTLALRGDALTSERGLTDTRHSTVPLHRVQAIEINQPLLWRGPGWWSLKVNVAGAHLGSADDDASDSVLVPVATTAEVLGLLEAVTVDPQTTAEVASLIDGRPAGFVGQPPASRWLHPLAHPRIGYLPGRRAVITRSGWTRRALQVVPWGRIQSMTLRQGPVSRRLDLASVDFISTVGPVRPRVPHLSRVDAEALGTLAAARSSRARRRPTGPVGCDPAPDTVDWPR